MGNSKMLRRRTWLGWFFIIAGMIYLMLPTIVNFYPMATVSFGPVELREVSEFSAINVFIGIVLISMGIFINTKQRIW